MNNPSLAAALALALGCAAPVSHAATLPWGTALTITSGVPVYDSNGDQITVSSGSWFGIDLSGDNKLASSERYAALSQGMTGFIIGMPTPPGASHPGPPAPGDTNDIDAPYDVWGQTASDYTTVGITGSTATGLDMSGWMWRFAGYDVNMGSGAWGAGFSNGIGNFVWDGVQGHAYTLDYRARVPFGDPSGFGGVGMAWHFEGVVAVPEASTYAMMLAGLGLVGVAARRRRQTM
jgi:hypothetical protein